ncbi:MAG: TM2 domain-containing protein [Treponema sp.]|nr:TM2 domain-containing protein [Treponema sp.]
MAFCSNCGAELKDGAAFCGECGTPVQKVSAEPVAVTPTEPVPATETTFTGTTTTVKPAEGPVSKKSRLVTLLLGIFLGNLGIHNFYRGKIGIGVTQVILTVLGFIFDIMGPVVIATSYYDDGLIALGGFLTFIGVIMIMVSSIWSFVEWILAACGVLRDKQGLLIKTWVD